jgi:hypothetical protein
MGRLIIPPSDAEQSMKSQSRSARGLVVPLLMFAVLAAAAGGPILRFSYYQSGVEGYLQEVHFDSEGRRNHALNSNPMWPTRLRMVDDLLERHLLGGRSREEVDALLGPRIDPLSPNWDLAYELGPERSFFRIDSEFLFIRLDSFGRVKEYHLTTH